MNDRFLFSVVSSFAALCAVAISSTTQLSAQTAAIGDGDWSTASTWTAGVPSSTLPATIDGGHTVTLSQFGQTASLLDVGTVSGETGNLDMTGGDLSVFDGTGTPTETAIRLGQAAGSTGNLTMSGGQVAIVEDIPDVFDSGDLVVGQNGTGTATISGGTFTAGDEILIGQNAGASGTVNVSGGTLAASRRNMQIGFSGADTGNSLPGGQGVVNVSGTGQLSIGDTIFLGFGDADGNLAGGHGELNISDSAQINVTGWVQSAFGVGSTAEINQSGGTVNISGLFVNAPRGQGVFNHTGGDFSADLVIIGDGVDGNTSHGIYNISGSATLSSNLVMWVGAWGRSQGDVNQTGGTINAGALTVGRDGSGTYNLSSGTINVNGTDGAVANNHLILGQVGNPDDSIAKGSGVFTQTGGMITAKTGVFLGDFDHSEGTYKISGGTLNVDGTGSHPSPGTTEDFIGDFSVGGALASNADINRVEPANDDDAQGQALAASGTFIVSGSDATINIAGNFLANPADKSSFRSGSPDRGNSATLGFEIFDSSGTSLIDVGGVADLDGAVIDMDLMNSFVPAVNDTFDLLKASSFGATGTGTTQNVGFGTGFSLAPEDAGGWSLAVVSGGGFETLQATFLGIVALPGDFDHDGDVDGNDFLVWQRGGSPNGINSGDLAIWQGAYGTPLAAAVGAVPEPSSVVLLLISAAALAASRNGAPRLRGRRSGRPLV